MIRNAAAVARYSLVLAALGFVSTAPCPAAEAEIAWEETFDDPGCLARGRFYVWDRHDQGGWRDELLIKEFEDGVFRYGLHPDPDRKADWVNLVYGNIVWGHKTWPEWGPFELKQWPIVEIRWRGMAALQLWYGKETAAGDRIQDYTYPELTRTETDEQGREWNVSVIRFAADSSVPGPHTPVKLLGINPQVITPTDGQDAVLELDYIRVRGFTAAEAAREAKVVDTLADFPKERWPGLDTFFPWGLYGTGFLRGDFEWWAGDYEGAYAIYSRHHINFVATNYEVEVSRIGGAGLYTDNWSAAVDRYAAAVQPLIEAARAHGLRRAADMRYLMAGRDAAAGYRQLLPVARRIAQEVHGDDDVVVAWTMADEPGVDKLLEMASTIRALREADPHKRPELVVFNNPNKMAPYVPYLSVNYWDHYPVYGRRREPWATRKQAREYYELLPDVPMWPVLQAFESMPPNDGTYTRPSDAEMRLMTYLVLAEGAKGVVWFHGYGSGGRDIHLLQRTGYPHGRMLNTVATLGKRIIPLGSQFLKTSPDKTVTVPVRQDTEPAEAEHVLAVSPLRYEDGGGWLLVAVNEDMDRTRAAAVTLPAPMRGRETGVYDLYQLDGTNLLNGDGSFAIAPLAGGDGRVLVVCDPARYQDIASKVRCDDSTEQVRALQPDLTIAQRWGLDVERVVQLVAACRQAAAAGDARRAELAARMARQLLDEGVANHSTLSMTRRALEDIQVDLDEVWHICEYPSQDPEWWTGGHHPMLVPNPKVLELSKRYWAAGRLFSDAYTRYVRGDRDGLWTLVNQARIACLEVRADALARLREIMKPDKEPEPAPD